MVCCDDDSGAVQDHMFAQMRLIKRAGHPAVRQCNPSCGRKTGNGSLAKVTALADAKNHGLQKAVEAAHSLGWRDFGEVPRSDGAFLHGILPNTHIAAEHASVINFNL
jgi:hypothetical protein